MSRWPIGQRQRVADVRYRFHTRSLEMPPMLTRLSKATPRLSFALVTHCLDDNDFGHYAISKGKRRGKWLGGDWRTPFYERAAERYKMTLDDVYEDDVVTSIAESWMRDAAMQIATGSTRRYEWTGGRVYRDLFDERADLMRQFAQWLPKTDVEI
jgi:hypothetical protein